MLNPDELEMLREIIQRLTRTESRMVQLGDYVGTNLRVRMQITVQIDPATLEAAVKVDAPDVSLARIYSEMRDKGVKTGQVVPVYHAGRKIASVYP